MGELLHQILPMASGFDRRSTENNKNIYMFVYIFQYILQHQVDRLIELLKPLQVSVVLLGLHSAMWCLFSLVYGSWPYSVLLGRI